MIVGGEKVSVDVRGAAGGRKGVPVGALMIAELRNNSRIIQNPKHPNYKTNFAKPAGPGEIRRAGTAY